MNPQYVSQPGGYRPPQKLKLSSEIKHHGYGVPNSPPPPATSENAFPPQQDYPGIPSRTKLEPSSFFAMPFRPADQTSPANIMQPPPLQSSPMAPPQHGGPLPPQQHGGPLPPQHLSGHMPPQQQSGGPMPPHPQSGPVPPQQQSGPMPPQQHSGPMPPQHNSSSQPTQQHGGPMPPQQNSSSLPPQQNSSSLPPQQHSGPMPPQQSGPMPPQQQSGPMPPQQSGPMPPQLHSGPMPPQQQSGPMPPQQSGPMPPQLHSGPMPPQQQSGPMPPQQQSGPMPPQLHSGPMPPQQQSGPMPPQQSGPMPPQLHSGPMPPQQQSGPMPPHQQSGPMPPQQSGPMPPQQRSGPMPPQQQSGPMPPQQSGHMPPQQQSGAMPPQHGGPMPNNFQQPPSSGVPLGYNSAPSHPGAPSMPLPVSSPGPGGPPRPSMYPPGSQMGRPQMPQVNQLAGQMSTMNINGSTMPPMNQQHSGEYPGGGMQGPPPMGYAPPGQPSRYPPAVNGGPPSQTMNGLPDTSGPGRPPQSRYPPMPESGGGQTTAYLQSPQQGYPPQPGFPPQPQPGSGYPGGGIGQPQYPQQQQRRLDPDQMPSPMQVMEDDQKTRSGVFYTHQKGQVPPLVTTEFIVQDQGNTSPRFMRSTMYNVPINTDMMKQASVPFGLVLSPMAEVADKEHPPPLVSFGEIGPVRCIRCKAYMCPNMQFIDGGRRFHCLLCKATTDVPAEYFQHLDHTGQRVDRFERAELVLGTYDIIATAEYCKDNQYPNPPALIFVIDVSYNNVKSGLVSLLCRQMKNILCSLPKERGQEKSPMKVGFITYNSAVHFYNIRPNLGQPQMLVVGDTQEMFMPLLDGFLVDPEESEGLIDALMTNIPMMFAETRETETILAPAIQAGLEALKASGCAGKLLVFHSSLPIAEAPGKLKNRDDRSLLGTDKEKTILLPQNTVYNTLGQDCVGAGVSVDLFITNNSYIDLATIGQVSRLTGGEIYKYTYFQAELDGERLITDVEKNIRRLCAFDAIMRVRTSTGIRPTDFYGHFYMSNTTDIELASIDPDKGIAVEIKHDDKLSEEEGVYIQVALLYTSLTGQRRIRVLNLVLKACSQMSDLYRTCELDTVINFFAKQSVFKLLDASAKAVKESLINRSAQILACYRKNCASPTSAGQLILPECMKLLPLYINCLLKSDAVSGGKDMTVDDKWFMMAAVLTMDVPSSLTYFYPRLYYLLDNEDILPPPCIRCSSEKMADNGVYLLVNGIYMFLWLGLATPSDWVMSVFGVPSVAQVDVDRHRLPVLDNPISERVRNTISFVADSNHRTMRLTMVRQRDKMEMVMKHFLVEDRGLDGSSSYVDFLCHLHKEIRNLLS